MRAPRLSAMMLATLLVAGGAAAQDDVTITLDRFGAGSYVRQGDWTAIRLTLTSAIDDAVAVPVYVVWEVPEATGDITEHSRLVTLNRGVPRSIWMYAKLQPSIQPSDQWTVRLYQENDGRRGREIGGTRISPNIATSTPAIVPPNVGLMAVVGSNDAGTTLYYTIHPDWPVPAGNHEITRVVWGLDASDIPDRWEGLLQYEAVIWTNVSPGALQLEQGDALREYVRRGGHLVIVLPDSGTTWELGAQGRNVLSDLLPQTAPRLDEGVTFATLLPILSKYRANQVRRDVLDTTTNVRVFETFDNHYDPHVALPDGRIVGVQRTFGFGRISVLGVNVGSQRLLSTDLVQADAFWNRILGRRADTLTRREMNDLSDSPLGHNRPNLFAFGKGKLITEQINLSGSALAGLGLAIFLFIAYWVVAGPGGFAALKMTKQVRHAWVAFALTSAAFTAIAWGGVTLIRVNDTRMKHLTVLDFIARRPDDLRPEEEQYHRGISWLSLYLPGYGDPEVSIESDPARRDLLAPFAAPDESITPFTNVDRYEVPLNSPARFRVPARSTTKELTARWMGSLDPEWGGIFEIVAPIELGHDASGLTLTGQIRQRLPGTLRDPKVWIIWPDRTQPPRYGPPSQNFPVSIANRAVYSLPNTAERHAPRALLETGDVLDLGEREDGARPTPLVMELKDYSKPHIGQQSFGPVDTFQSVNVHAYLEMLSVFHMLEPPEYLKPSPSGNVNTVAFSRSVGRELDLSAWFTRPCLIVTGFLDASECPVPIRVNGNMPRSEGITMVRWIYPLEIDPSSVVPRETASESNAEN